MIWQRRVNYSVRKYFENEAGREMDKKIQAIAIITLNGYSNYGNRLQNYALQQVLLRYSNTVDTLLIENEKRAASTHNTSSNSIHELLERLQKFSFSRLNKKVSTKVHSVLFAKQIQKNTNRRIANFKKFSETYIHEKNLGITPGTMGDSLESQYEYFVVGSDQVWNPRFSEFSEAFFLTFAPPKKRVAYAPSFGIEKIPVEFHSAFYTWLKDVPFLSVRENSGAKIIKDLIGIDVPVLLDPTMLLAKEDWLTIAKQPSFAPTSAYILVYFLGHLPKDYERDIKRFAKKNAMELVFINDMRYQELYSIDPSEFVSLIYNSSFVFTDSFHGVAFSLILERPFLPYRRIGKTDTFSRIETLLDKFALAERMSMQPENDDIWEIDFDKVRGVLLNERNRSASFLDACLT